MRTYLTLFVLGLSSAFFLLTGCSSEVLYPGQRQLSEEELLAEIAAQTGLDRVELALAVQVMEDEGGLQRFTLAEGENDLAILSCVADSTRDGLLDLADVVPLGQQYTQTCPEIAQQALMDPGVPDDIHCVNLFRDDENLVDLADLVIFVLLYQNRVEFSTDLCWDELAGDADLLPSYQEAEAPNNFDPLNEDSDGDGITDYDELYPPNAYQVQVQASGFSLPYSGTVVLQNNHSDVLVISTDGLHSFSRLVEDGENYHVTVAFEPRLQNCELTNALGSIDGADVIVSLECTDKSWTHPQNLSEAISLAAYDVGGAPHLAMNGEGDAVVVWQQLDYLGPGNTVRRIFKKEYRNGGWDDHPYSFDDFINLSGSAALFPDVAINEEGTALVTWMQAIDQTWGRVFICDYPDQTHCPSDANDYISASLSPEWVAWPTVLMDGTGHALVGWPQWSAFEHHDSFVKDSTNGLWNQHSDHSQNGAGCVWHSKF